MGFNDTLHLLADISDFLWPESESLGLYVGFWGNIVNKYLFYLFQISFLITCIWWNRSFWPETNLVMFIFKLFYIFFNLCQFHIATFTHNVWFNVASNIAWIWHITAAPDRWKHLVWVHFKKTYIKKQMVIQSNFLFLSNLKFKTVVKATQYCPVESAAASISSSWTNMC